MAEQIPLLTFSKDWRRPTDFPTYEGTEAQVREDMQCLHEETRQFINDRLVPAFGEAVEDIKTEMATEIDKVVAGAVPDNTITVNKFKAEALATSNSASDTALVTAGYMRDYALPRILVPGRDVGTTLPSNARENQLFFLLQE